MRCEIKFHWDNEASVWTATSDDIPGLVLESGSFDALLERVKQAAPELITMNGMNTRDCRLLIRTEREELVPMYG